MATSRARKTSNSTESQTADDSPIIVIKDATCLSSTGKSTLGYQIGTDEKGSVHFKLTSNSGGGQFTSSWISFTDVQAALKAWPQHQPVTSMALRPLSKGKSANNAGFACAVLVSEGFLEKIPGKSRVHTAIDPKLFRAKVEALKAGDGRSAKQPARKPRSKAAPKAKATSRKKPAAKSASTPRKGIGKLKVRYETFTIYSI
jgi:hypothetical protein